MLHVIIMILCNNSPKVYQFIIGFSHILSGYLVYILLKKIGINKENSICAGIIWSISPFARVQTFHHWSYLMLPLYLLLFFYWYLLKTIDLKTNQRLSIIKYFKMIAIMVCVIFTGEYTLVPLFFSLFIFALISKIKKNNFLLRIFSILFCSGILFLTTYLVIYKMFINRSEEHRFSVIRISLMGGLRDFVASIIYAVKTFLYIPNIYTELYPSELNINSFKYSNFWICGFLFLLGIVVFVWGLYQLHKGKETIEYYEMEKESKKSIKRRETLLLLAMIGLSFGGIYVILDVAMGQGLLPVRYFYSFLTILLTLCFILLSENFPNCRCFLFSFIMLISLINLIIYKGVMLPEVKAINLEIISYIERAEEDGYKNIVFLGTEGVNSDVLTARQSYRADSPFDWGWATNILINNQYKFDNIIFLKQGDIIKEVEGDKLILHNSYSDNEGDVIIDKSNTFFLGLADLEYNNGRERIPQRVYYYGYEEFCNSQYYRGVEAAVMGEQVFSSFHHTLGYAAWTQEEVYWINCGIEEESNRFKPDVSYLSIKVEDEVYGGYDAIGNIGYTNNANTNESYYSTYRCGTEFSYMFFNIPEDMEYILAFDILESYYNIARKRFFDIKIETDRNSFTLEDLDTIAICNGKSEPVRIMVHLPKCGFVKVTFKQDSDCLDIPYINGIGILKRLEAVNSIE